MFIAFRVWALCLLHFQCGVFCLLHFQCGFSVYHVSGVDFSDGRAEKRCRNLIVFPMRSFLFIMFPVWGFLTEELRRAAETFCLLDFQHGVLCLSCFQCGFFRRKSREELQKLIETSSHPEEFESLQPPSPSSAPPPFPSLADDDDVMVLPPTNSFFPDPAQQTLLLRNNNNISSDNFNHVHHRSGSLGYSSHQHQHGGSGGGGVFGGSLGRNRGHQQQHHHHWTPPPPPPLPAFNNQLYLEPLEHTV